MKMATVYLYKQKIYVRSSSKTSMGVWMDEGPCYVVDQQDPAEVIAKAVIAAVDASRVDIEHPISWSNVNNALLASAGVKAWNTFGKVAKCILIEVDKDGMKIKPTVNMGKNGGFVVEDHRVISVSSIDVATIGDAIVKVIKQ